MVINVANVAPAIQNLAATNVDEGGMTTLSAFLARGCLDRLHVAIAPVILGSGPVGMSLPPIERVDLILDLQLA